MSKILHHHSPVDNQHANMLSTSAKMSQDDIKTSPILSASILATKKSKSAMSSDAKLWSSFMKMLFIHNHSVSMINFTPIYTSVSLLQNQDRYTQDRLIEDEECHEPEPPVKCAVLCVGSVLRDATKQRCPQFRSQNWTQQGTLTRQIGNNHIDGANEKHALKNSIWQI